jgi:hypothetical protein
MFPDGSIDALVQAYADHLFRARNQNQAVREIAWDLNRRAWTRLGNPAFTYDEKIAVVEKVARLVRPPQDGMTRLGGDNSQTLALIRALTQSVTK